jgi:hypothetical protein
LAALDSLARGVPRIVLVATGGEPPAGIPGGFEVVPWLGQDGLGSAAIPPTAVRVGAPA